MSAPATSAAVLGAKLCPWLYGAFEQLEGARRSQHLGHAWLIVGPAGVGKINLALAFAQRLLAGEGAAPAALGAREAVAALALRHAPADHHPDLHWLHPEEEKHTISVEQVRNVIEAVSLTAHGGRAKVVVVEPADAMTTAAANALLKTLEEPSAETYLLLLSHQPGRLPATIRSRCQRLSVTRPALPQVADWLQGPSPEAVADAWDMAGQAPLAAADLLHGADFAGSAQWATQMADLAAGRLDAQSVAAAWVKDDVARELIWLSSQLQRAIRHRFAPSGSTSVTDSQGFTLHNAWRDLTLGALFSQHDRSERLLGQLGSGLNVDLALQALLVGFELNRGRS
jgi:DNA polymerase III subunit delta'